MNPAPSSDASVTDSLPDFAFLVPVLLTFEHRIAQPTYAKDFARKNGAQYFELHCGEAHQSMTGGETMLTSAASPVHQALCSVAQGHKTVLSIVDVDKADRPLISQLWQVLDSGTPILVERVWKTREILGRQAPKLIGRDWFSTGELLFIVATAEQRSMAPKAAMANFLHEAFTGIQVES